MTTILERLARATDREQKPLFLDAVDYAEREGWIDFEQAARAREWINMGAFESAALSVVPEGWKPSLMSWGAEEFAQPHERVTMFMTLVSDDYRGHIRGEVRANYGATPALALWIAALKAHQSQTETVA